MRRQKVLKERDKYQWDKTAPTTEQDTRGTNGRRGRARKTEEMQKL